MQLRLEFEATRRHAEPTDPADDRDKATPNGDRANGPGRRLRPPPTSDDLPVSTSTRPTQTTITGDVIRVPGFFDGLCPSLRVTLRLVALVAFVSATIAYLCCPPGRRDCWLLWAIVGP